MRTFAGLIVSTSNLFTRQSVKIGGFLTGNVYLCAHGYLILSIMKIEELPNGECKVAHPSGITIVYKEGDFNGSQRIEVTAGILADMDEMQIARALREIGDFVAQHS